MFYVYKILNVDDGMFYIGQTKIEGWKNYYGSGNKIKEIFKMLKAEGGINLVKEILHKKILKKCMTRKEAKMEESRWIAYFKDQGCKEEMYNIQENRNEDDIETIFHSLKHKTFMYNETIFNGLIDLWKNDFPHFTYLELIEYTKIYKNKFVSINI